MSRGAPAPTAPGGGSAAPASAVPSSVAGSPSRLAGLQFVILAVICWSTAGLFITSLVRDGGIPPLSLAFWRMLVTCLCLVAYLAIRQRHQLRIKTRDLPWFAAMGALAVASFQVAWIFAVITVGPSVATIIQCNAPIIVTLLARLIWREPLTWQKWTAIGLASLGTILIAWPTEAGALAAGGALTLTGFLVALGSAFSYAGITLFTKKLARDYSSWTILAYAFGFAALVLLPFQFGLGQGSGASHFLPPIDRGNLLTFAAFVLITTISGYALFATGLRRLPASVASIAAMAEVPFAAAFAYVFLGDRLSLLQVFGAVIVVSGVALLSLRPQRRAPAVQNPPES